MTTDESGRAVFSDVPPGRHQARAAAELNAPFMARYESRGTPVSVEPRQLVQVTVERIPAAR